MIDQQPTTKQGLGNPDEGRHSDEGEQRRPAHMANDPNTLAQSRDADGQARMSIPRRWMITSGDQELVGIWLVLRVLLGVWAALAGTVRPQTTSELRVPLWPPAAPLFAWLERAIVAPWERQDVTYYKWIVERGYRADDGTAQFHPLFAWVAAPLAWITGNAVLSLLIVSSLTGLLMVLAFERLARLDLSPEQARTSTLLLLFAPPAFVLFAPYSESLFLLCTVLCLLMARRGRWWLAGAAGALATLTRQQGIFLALPLAWELWEASRRNPKEALRKWPNWLAVSLIPAGLLIWLVYRGLALGDLQANFSHPQALIYSLLISPSASKVVPHQAFLLPWQALGLAIQTYLNEPKLYRLLDLVLGAGFLVLLAAAWRHMRASYRIYAVAIVLVSFAYHTGPYFPYMGLPRHLLLAVPVFIGLGAVFRGRASRAILVGSGFLAMLFLLLQFAISAWIL
jgi:hypothetical protein